MNRIESVFRHLKGIRPARIIYLTSGYPDLKTTFRTVLALEKAGADIIELGIPFSDPIADGPVIQKASWLALRHGYTIEEHLGLVKELRKKTVIPLAIMTYANLIAGQGYGNMIRKSAVAGVDGFIIPDLPLEEAEKFSGLCKRSGLVNVCFASETSSKDRLRRIAGLSTGFVYVVSQPSVTGSKLHVGKALVGLSKTLRELTSKPLAVGFGISSHDDVKALSPHFDGIIVGSAFLKRMLDAGGRPGKAVGFVRRLFGTG